MPTPMFLYKKLNFNEHLAAVKLLVQILKLSMSDTLDSRSEIVILDNHGHPYIMEIARYRDLKWPLLNLPPNTAKK